MWFRSLFDSANFTSTGASRGSKKRRPPRRRAPARLQLEGLEDLCLLTFLAPVDYGTAGYAGEPFSAVAAGDFANNGIRDLAVAGYSSVSVLTGNGDGTFQQAHTYGTGGTNTASVAVGDLTGDGKLDIVTANDGYGYDGAYHYFPAVPGSVSVLMGNGDGTFQAPLDITLPDVVPPGSGPSPQSPVSVALGDMNHDGRLDAVVTANTTAGYGYVDVLVGHGDGTFSVASTTLLGRNYGQSVGQSVELGDFSGDGNLDVATLMSPANDVAVLLGNGDGTLAAPTYFATGAAPQSLAVGDVNGDGKLDLVTANDAGESVSVLLGNGNGTFHSPIDTALPGLAPTGYSGVQPLPLPQRPLALVMGDLNGDGKMDLAVTATSSYSQYTGSGYYGGKYYATINKSSVNVLLGNGDGTFTAAETDPLDGTTPASITAGNFNGDNFPDLAVGDSNSDTVSVLINGADWSPRAPAPSSFSVSGFPASTQAGVPGNFTVTALNDDGTADTGYTGTVSFSSPDVQAALPGVYTFTSGDAGVHTFSATLKTAGTQSITATDRTTSTVTASETGITVTPAAASHLAVSAPAGSTAGSAFSVTVTALDPYNNTASGYGGIVHFTSSDGQASLPADYTFTAADAGVHTFTSGVTLKTAGSQTVTATDAVTGSITGSATVGVTAAAASTMTVAGFPSPVTAGVAGSFTVTLRDAYGNVATGYTGTVHFTSSDGKAVLPANYTFTSVDAGKHTFSATLKTAGTQSIKASDGTLAATDAGITVKPAAASKFILVAPSSVEPGVAFSLTIKVEDAYGNVVTGYVGTVHFSSSDSRAALPANYTFKAGDDGVHTFTGLVLRKPGNQTITVTDTHKSSITGKAVVDVL